MEITEDNFELDPFNCPYYELPSVQREVLSFFADERISPLAREVLMAKLAYFGSQDLGRLKESIEKYEIGSVFRKQGLFSKVSRFWDKHKKEIIIGLVVVAAVIITGVALSAEAGANMAVAGTAGAISNGSKGAEFKPSGSQERSCNSNSRSKAVEDKPIDLPLQRAEPDFYLPNYLENFKDNPFFEKIVENAFQPFQNTPIQNFSFESSPLNVFKDNGSVFLGDTAPLLFPLNPDSYIFKPVETPSPTELKINENGQFALTPPKDAIPTLEKAMSLFDRAIDGGPVFTSPFLSREEIIKLNYRYAETFSNEDIAQFNKIINLRAGNPFSEHLRELWKNEPPLIGENKLAYKITGINGICTSREDVEQYKKVFSRMASGYPIDWTYNKDIGLVRGAADAFFNQMLSRQTGSSGKELVNQWQFFDFANKENPKAKLLHLCHSQGVLITRNTLKTIPPHLAKRVIAVAVAPPDWIYDQDCYKAINIISKKDWVPYAKYAYQAIIHMTQEGATAYRMVTKGKTCTVIVLDPHPDAEGMDHALLSKTYNENIKKIFKRYMDGEFHKEEN